MNSYIDNNLNDVSYFRIKPDENREQVAKTSKIEIRHRKSLGNFF
jgi:hypothetical protein